MAGCRRLNENLAVLCSWKAVLAEPYFGICVFCLLFWFLALGMFLQTSKTPVLRAAGTRAAVCRDTSGVLGVYAMVCLVGLSALLQRRASGAFAAWMCADVR